MDAENHENREKLYHLIDHPDEIDEGYTSHYDSVRGLIENGVTVLASFGNLKPYFALASDMQRTGWCRPALVAAADSDNHEAARAILDVMNEPGNAEKILQQVKKEGRLAQDCKHPFYMNTINGPQLPHNVITNPKMLKIFTDRGYDVNTTDIKTSLLERVISQLKSTLTIAGESPVSAPEPADEFLRTAIKSGMHIRNAQYERCDDKSYHDPTIYAFEEICEAAWDISDTDVLVENIDCPFTMLAHQGFDFRPILTSNWEVVSPFPDELGIKIHETARNHIKAYAHDAVEKYMQAKTESQRRDYALAACSGDAFSELLAKVIEADGSKGKDKGVKDVLSCLDDYWKNEYKNLIRAASASLVRTSPVTKELSDKALARYAGGDQVPARGA